ncbi:hypothetical protein YB2330_005689 [Saitoella coloradoensis]
MGTGWRAVPASDRATRSGAGPSTPFENPRSKRVHVEIIEAEDSEGEERLIFKLKSKKLKTGVKEKAPVIFDPRSAGLRAQLPDIHKRRDRFVHHHRKTFLPLLPQSNYVAKLANSAHPPPAGFHPYRLLDSQPNLIKGGEMKDYQIQGLSFMVYLWENGMNGILGDEMGLGKTLQTLSMIAWLKENKDHKGPHLVVCPLSVLQNWMAEIERWVPSLTALRYHGGKTERERLKTQARENEYDVVVTTYEQYVAEDAWFKKRAWGAVVVDEGHRMKNEGTNIAMKLVNITCQWRLLLTGTPLQNNLRELWALLHWLYPDIFTPTTSQRFHDSFDLTGGKYDTGFIDSARKLLEIVMIRRMKQNLEHEFKVPEKEEVTIYLPLSPMQRFWYKRLLTRLDKPMLEEILEGKGPSTGGTPLKVEVDTPAESQTGTEVSGSRLSAIKLEAAMLNQANAPSDSKESGEWKKLMNLLMQLRKACSHPYLLPGSEPDPYILDDHIIEASSKIQFLDKLLPTLRQEGRRCLIFTQWTRMLDVLQDYCEYRDIKFARLDGYTSRPRRTLDIKLFQQKNSPYEVYMISTKAGNLGINLTAADTVVMMDSMWNPQDDLQAIARAHRIGQTQKVKVYRLICQDTVEDQMLSRIRKKLYLSAKITASLRDLNNGNSEENGKGDEEEQGPTMARGDLIQILRAGTGAMGRIEAEEWEKMSLEEILEQSKQTEQKKDDKVKREAGLKQDDGEEKKVSEEDEERKLLAGVEHVRTRMFEGQHYAKTVRGIADEWRDIQGKRTREERTVNIDGNMVLKETLGNEFGESVKTLSSQTGTRHAPKKKDGRGRKKFEHQDYCWECKDGGFVIECGQCPRVYHPKCIGWNKNDVKRTTNLVCPQHNCCMCARNTTNAGGMLFRCSSCPNSFCEDCLPPGDIIGYGTELPVLLAFGYPEVTQAYYIRCSQCIDYYSQHPEAQAAYEAEDREARIKLGMDLEDASKGGFTQTSAGATTTNLLREKVEDTEAKVKA